ncbi:Protein kinase-like domain protein [Moelleriella libera RCEF 2490]|uniref:Protein kinase-like domain protein n=1 Tax=Moelleriella libera RCEF 2490 TaxID=1081109 RepID=A0A168D4L3_9HYPO|nr:Protein kinase-like domain protein [Moelleriella libera RCEF 2490]
MAPRIESWDDFLWVAEAVDEETGQFRYTRVVATAEEDDDDMVFHGYLYKRQADVSLSEATGALARIPDDEIFPRCSRSLGLTRAPDELQPCTYIKRPNLALYDQLLLARCDVVVDVVRKELLEEAQALEAVTAGDSSSSSSPHPNFIGYYGCRVRRGHITGIMLDRHPFDLHGYLKSGHVLGDKACFMRGLASAVRYLHALGWAHNDLTPSNVLVSDDQSAILAGFGAARRIGERLGANRGTEGWTEHDVDDYTTSKAEHDVEALARLNAWLDDPTF